MTSFQTGDAADRQSNTIAHYQAFGLVFRSELRLPNIPECSLQRQVDATVRFGAVPQHLPDAIERCGLFEANSRECLFGIDGVARYWIRDGREIVIEPAARAAELTLCLFLMGSAFGALLHQRGLLPLHANAVHVGDACVAFMGPSGAGKSTLTAFLNRRGHAVLCDDVCAVHVQPGQGALVDPSFPRFKLWADSLQALQANTIGLSRVRPDLEKYLYAFANEPFQARVPLRRLYLLQRGKEVRLPNIEPMLGLPRLKSLLDNTYAYHFVKGLGLTNRHFQACASMLDDVAVCSLQYPDNFACLPDVLACLEDDFRRAVFSAPAAKTA